jgi:hypothetical protein
MLADFWDYIFQIWLTVYSESDELLRFVVSPMEEEEMRGTPIATAVPRS